MKVGVLETSPATKTSGVEGWLGARCALLGWSQLIAAGVNEASWCGGKGLKGHWCGGRGGGPAAAH